MTPTPTPTPTTSREQAVPVATRLGSGEGLARTEWVLANGLGGFAMGTASGIPARRYHGWLVGSARPPVARVLALSSMAEWLVLLPGAAGGTSEQRYDLSSFRFSGATGGLVSPKGVESLQRFEKGAVAVTQEYKFGLVKASREIRPLHGQNAVMIRYRVRTGGHAANLELHPLVALRDFHGPLIDHHARAEAYTVKPLATGRGGVEVVHQGWHLSISAAGVSSGATFTASPHWWYNFEYMREAERGLDAHEDLYCPGMLSVPLPSFPAVSGDDLEHVIDVTASFWAEDGLGGGGSGGGAGSPRVSHAADAVAARMGSLVAGAVHALEGGGGTLAAGDRAAVASLAAAGDAFIVERAVMPGGGGGGKAVSVIAGYPWFSDWGRDTMISLRGLFLETGRAAEAKRVLETFAKYTDHGLIPNCFDDVTGEPQYHTVDASLWFVHAACDYLKATGDAEGFWGVGGMHGACAQILEKYRNGITHRGEDGVWTVKMDTDGLIMAGHPGTALTWMDARRDGTVFTPRDGKPVEIQALWYHALLAMADAVEAKDAKRAREYRQIAGLTGASIAARYWDPAKGYLADRLMPDHSAGGGWVADWSNRCNQIFAASLAHSALTPAMRAGVVATVKARLLTPMGLRTLDPRDPRYMGRYRGPLYERDKAYHNGTVWPWLMGPYVVALLRSGAEAGRTSEATTEARASLAPLLASVTAGLAAGTLPEIFDAEVPVTGYQRADGCMAQAWSVAQTLEALAAIVRAERI